MKTLTATFAVLLLAGASTAAMAQDPNHGADTQIHPAQPAPHAPAPPPPAPHAGYQAPQGGHARFGAPPPAGNAPPAAPPRGEASQGQAFQQHGGGQGHDGQARDGQGRYGQNRDGQQHFQGQPPVIVAPGSQHFDRGVASDHNRGPRDGGPPANERGQFAGRDGHWDGARTDSHDGQWSGDHRDGDRRGGGRWDGGQHQANRGNNPWSHGQRWQAGRAPSVFWSSDRYRIGAYRAPYGYYARTWGFGDFLPRGWYAEDYWIGDFLDYDLPYPPPGYEWVRVGGDALMIDRYTGRIVQVVRGIFW